MIRSYDQFTIGAKSFCDGTTGGGGIAAAVAGVVVVGRRWTVFDEG